MTLLWEGKFNPNDHRGSDIHTLISEVWNTYCCLWRSDSFQVVPSPEGRPGYAGKFNIAPGDNCNVDANTNLAAISRTEQVRHGDERWYSVSLWLPPGFTHSTWMTFWQMKTIDGGYGSIGITSGVLGQSPTKFGGTWGVINNGYYSTSNLDDLGLITSGWNDFLIHQKWTDDSTGFTEYYRNGVMVSSHHNIVTRPLIGGVPVSPAFEFMALSYRGQEPRILDTYRYNIKIGEYRQDVEYTGSNPPPTCPQATLNMII